MIARPLRVAMRARKPCLRARFSRLGWKVRFISLFSTWLEKNRLESIESGRHKRRIIALTCRAFKLTGKFTLFQNDWLYLWWSSYPQGVRLKGRLVLPIHKSIKSFFCSVQSQRPVEAGIESFG
jgi:hypothetical protein